ncbi:hypothetical protein GUITHDRAFT_121099 [Guillardia theta CCMP2712]|uniref:Uncharacterized protein n=1 Tax=Guillardia theta (strain CCMP2712) TaxID=905079 RepID=L1IA73_GUITC|nr:hypothetical protein GUITHDRAFT_121099 [Guillardia theta CCMP2712]EKX32745.1 hypothetical protein GUITHDRAFT_121099 [Guillardia theta CCMP2712]|eukprot:XP_005819725.1 hypothetical protein GUITHDRAFT_121099 [Guillardia theta CCMP2712]
MRSFSNAEYEEAKRRVSGTPKAELYDFVLVLQAQVKELHENIMTRLSSHTQTQSLFNADFKEIQLHIDRLIINQQTQQEKHEREISKLEAEKQSILDDLKREHVENLKTMQLGHMKQVQDMLEKEEEERKQWEEKLRGEKESSQENLIELEKRLRAIHENEMDDMEQRHEQRLEDLKEKLLKEHEEDKQNALKRLEVELEQDFEARLEANRSKLEEEHQKKLMHLRSELSQAMKELNDAKSRLTQEVNSRAQQMAEDEINRLNDEHNSFLVSHRRFSRLERKEIKELVNKVDAHQLQLDVVCERVRDMVGRHSQQVSTIKVMVEQLSVAESEGGKQDESRRLMEGVKQAYLEELRMFNQRMRQVMEAKETKEKRLRGQLNDYKQRLHETETILARQYREMESFSVELL